MWYFFVPFFVPYCIVNDFIKRQNKYLKILLFDVDVDVFIRKFGLIFKLGQLIGYLARNIFVEKVYKKINKKLVPLPFFSLFLPVSHCFRAWPKKNLKVYDVINCLNKNVALICVVGGWGGVILPPPLPPSPFSLLFFC